MALHSKQDFQNLMHRLLNPLKPWYSEGKARLSLGTSGYAYSVDGAELEGFSRPLWGLVPFWAGGGRDADFENIYIQGLCHGSDPAHREYWGGFGDYDQRFVEMAAIACGMLLAPERVWDPLPADAKTRLAKWLYGINEHTLPKCNWLFFLVLVDLALKKRGCPYDAERLEQSLEELESYYVGGGWYRDGTTSQKDYYIAFAMHYYGLVYSVAAADEDPERSARFRERAEIFAKDFIYWFDENGAALPFGRSLTYRFAQCSFWAACIFAGIDPFPLEVMKGIIVRNLEWWMDRKIFDRDGILTIGYGYANLMMSENYNAPGSPYWAMKTFLVLALPDDHPFWGAEAGDLPALPALRPLPRAEMLMQRRENDAVAYTAGVCELYGHGHLIEKYSKFAYSTAFGFSCQRSGFVLEEACPDSMLAFVLDSTVFVRKRSDVWRVEEDRVYSEWSPMPGLRVRTTLYPTSWGHVRQHEITNTNSWEYAAYDCGFSVPRDLGSSLEQVCQGPVSAVRFAGRSCIVFGQGPEAEGTVIGADPNTNLIYPNTCIPAVKYRIGVGKTTLITRVWTQALTGEDGVFQSSLEEDAAWVCAAGEEPQ